MKINGNEIRPGNVILHNGDLYAATLDVFQEEPLHILHQF